MDYVANPFNFWINGQQRVEFTYDPGPNPKLWHVRMPEKGVVRFNILMWAQDENALYGHLLAAVDVQRKCEARYLAVHVGRHHEEVVAHHAHRNSKWDLIDQACKDRTMQVGLAPMDQVFKVAWASNDDI